MPGQVGETFPAARRMNRVMLIHSDAELISQARNDPDAFGELYRRHARAVYAWFRARTDSTSASELTAETFAQAALSLRRFRDEARGSAAPWLFGIARNLLRRFYERESVERRARTKLGMPIRSYELDVDEIVSSVDAERAASAVASALDELPATQRDALELRVVHELPYEAVASRLGCSEVAARIRVTRALGALSRLLKGVAL